MKDFILIGEGRNRAVWRIGSKGSHVIKIPLNEYGVGDNFHEAETYRRSKGKRTYVQYAQCRLFGETCLIMEYAGYIGPKSDENGYIKLENCPEWAYSVDCWQVGYNRNGRIVAYDYGLH